MIKRNKRARKIESSSTSENGKEKDNVPSHVFQERLSTALKTHEHLKEQLQDLEFFRTELVGNHQAITSKCNRIQALVVKFERVLIPLKIIKKIGYLLKRKYVLENLTLLQESILTSKSIKTSLKKFKTDYEKVFKMFQYLSKQTDLLQLADFDPEQFGYTELELKDLFHELHAQVSYLHKIAGFAYDLDLDENEQEEQGEKFLRQVQKQHEEEEEEEGDGYDMPAPLSLNAEEEADEIKSDNSEENTVAVSDNESKDEEVRQKSSKPNDVEEEEYSRSPLPVKTSSAKTAPSSSQSLNLNTLFDAPPEKPKRGRKRKETQPKSTDLNLTKKQKRDAVDAEFTAAHSSKALSKELKQIIGPSEVKTVATLKSKTSKPKSTTPASNSSPQQLTPKPQATTLLQPQMQNLWNRKPT